MTHTVGARLVFRPVDQDGMMEQAYFDHYGQTVTIVKHQPPDDWRARETWLVEADDGWRADAFIEELAAS